MDRNLAMTKYADLLVRLGVALQKDQYMLLDCDADCYELARHIVHRAMELGARDVIVHMRDPHMDKSRVMFGAPEEIVAVRDWQRESLEYYLTKGACSLSLKSTRPELLSDLPASMGETLRLFSNDLRNSIRRHWGISNTNWCIACVPNQEWANVIYPGMDDQAAYDRLWDDLMSFCMVDETTDPVENWIEFSDGFAKYSKRLNDLGVDKIHFEAGNGTDLTVGFNKKAFWVGGKERATRSGTENMANMPSNEVASSPDNTRVDGIVYSSRPLVYGGQIIDKFYLRFENGRVVEHHAEVGHDLLTMLLDTDEGSRSIGEVAFVECDRPLAKSGLVFHNTLLDENAACHIALGSGYAICIPGLSMTDPSTWAAENLNSASQHVDFMFGTEDMKATVTCHDGKEVVYFENGLFTDRS